MRRHRPEPFSSLLQQYLRLEGLETPLQEYRVVQAWPQVAGDAISRYTGQVFVRDGQLYVQIKSAPLRQNLSMQQTILTRRLNEYVGGTVISAIRFF